MKSKHLFMLAVTALSGQFFLSTPTHAQVTGLLLDNSPDPPTPLPTTLYLGNAYRKIIPSSSNNPIASINWTGNATAPLTCSRSNLQFNGDTSGVQLLFGSLGLVYITANVTYQQLSTNPPTQPAPNSVTGTINVMPPTGFSLYFPPDPTVSHPFTDTNDPNDNPYVYIYMHLLYNGVEAPGYNMGAEEKISYTVPAGTAPDFNGGWGRNLPVLTMGSDGSIQDLKAFKGDGWDNNGPGTIFLQYSQDIGVWYQNWCGEIQDVYLGTIQITFKRSAPPNPLGRWTVEVTGP